MFAEHIANDMNNKIKIGVEISVEKFAESLIAALEGGSNYWYLINTDEHWFEVVNRFDKSIAQQENRDKALPLSMRITNAIANVDDFSIAIYDAENPDEKLGELSRESLLNGIAILAANYPLFFARINSEDYDANDADVFFQICLFGEIVYC